MSFVVQAIGNSKQQRKETDELFRILNLKKSINDKTLESFEDARIRSLLGVEAGVTKTDMSSEDRTRNKFAQEDLALANIQSIVGINQNAFDIYQKIKSDREIQNFNILFPKFNEVYKSLPNINWLNFMSLWQAFKNEITKYSGPLFTPAPPAPILRSQTYIPKYDRKGKFEELGAMNPRLDGTDEFSLRLYGKKYDVENYGSDQPPPEDFVKMRQLREMTEVEPKSEYGKFLRGHDIEPQLEKVAEIITTPISERVNAEVPLPKLETVTSTGTPLNLANYIRDNFGDDEQKIYERYLNSTPNRNDTGTVGEQHIFDALNTLFSNFDRLPKFDFSEKTKLVNFLQEKVNASALHEFGRTGAIKSEAELPDDTKDALKLLAVLENEITHLPKESPKQPAATPKKEVNVSVQTLNKMDDYELDNLFRKMFQNKFGATPKNDDQISIPIAKDLEIPFSIKLDSEFDDLVSLQPADPAYTDDPRAESTNNIKINFIRNAANKEFKQADWNPTPQVKPAKMQITPAASPEPAKNPYTLDESLRIVEKLLQDLADHYNSGKKPDDSYVNRISKWITDKSKKTIREELNIDVTGLMGELQDVYGDLYGQKLKSESKEGAASSASSKASSGMQVLLNFYKDPTVRPKEQLVDTSSAKYKKLLNKRLEAYRENVELKSLTPAEALEEIHKLESDFVAPNQLLKGQVSQNYWKLRSLLGMWAENIAPSEVIINQFLSPQETKDNIKLEMDRYGGRYPNVTQGSGLRITKKKKSAKTKSKKKTLKIKFPM